MRQFRCAIAVQRREQKFLLGNVRDAQFPADDHAPWVKHDRGEERADQRRAGQLL
ncbi:hypothetical protein KUL72_09795 [Bradyrhizobium arachidis]|uniref:hypothetical protein n=1 Tax=Bradyrhizobium TaxID=374 RepID=UPI00188BD394|nr:MULTISPECIES: hypothetical protein [Bradyrhizobium]MDN4985081.1 hypothetical protein [Bradyrhizobium sp. WYCCWR 13022]UVO38622.1 hypothetical protein KUL72_09795 [Bradyrhizobium arachidis]